jgi:RNA polymerase sigma factor (sigma-70 family)
MRPRNDLIEIFSTFLQFEADRPQGWVRDPRLNRNMVRSYQSDPQGSENFWVTYWFQRYQDQIPADQIPTDQIPIAQTQQLKQSLGHLSAYLQETCFWAVQRVMPRLGSVQMKLSDCFQVAIVDVPRLLKAFDASKPSSLKTYANTVFSNTLRDYLRQRREIDFCSDWGLLLKISRKRLLEALNANNLEPRLGDRYLLAWKCLTENYSPQKSPKLRTMEAPDAATWETIVQMYNQARQSLPHLEQASAQDLEKCLTDAAKKVRAYLYPTVGSLNVKKGEDSDSELQDDLAMVGEQPMIQLLEQEDQLERKTQSQQMAEVLSSTIAQMDAEVQKMLQLYYQEHLTQQQIAKKLEIQQYNVSRRLTKTRETLLRAVVQWGQTHLHISPTSDVMSSISAFLEEWLESFYNASERTS